MTEPHEHSDVDMEQSEGSGMRSDQNWRIDKHIPLALILTVLLQTATIAWWASGVSFRIDQLERQAAVTMPQGERLIKLETKFDALIEAVNEVKTLLRQPPPSR